MNKYLKIFLFLFGIGLISGIGVYLYVFHKPHRNIAKEKSAFQVTAIQLLDEFSSDETATYAKYGNQVLEVSGNVADVSKSEGVLSIVLEDASMGVTCAFDSIYVTGNSDLLKNISTGTSVKLKGQCDGYDMIMGVVLTRCVLVE